MNKIIVKRSFNHEKVRYGAGKEVSAELAKLYPEHVKVVGEYEVKDEVAVEVEEVPEEAIKESKAKASKSKKKKR